VNITEKLRELRRAWVRMKRCPCSANEDRVEHAIAALDPDALQECIDFCKDYSPTWGEADKMREALITLGDPHRLDREGS
jgi:hypothetical protein